MVLFCLCQDLFSISKCQTPNRSHRKSQHWKGFYCEGRCIWKCLQRVGRLQWDSQEKRQMKEGRLLLSWFGPGGLWETFNRFAGWWGAAGAQRHESSSYCKKISASNLSFSSSGPSLTLTVPQRRTDAAEPLKPTDASSQVTAAGLRITLTPCSRTG